MRILFLDDEFERYLSLKKKYPDAEIIWCQTNEAVRDVLFDGPFLREEMWVSLTHISIDHDLGFPDCGCSERNAQATAQLLFNCIDYIREYGICLNIHSWNPIGAKTMQDMLNCTCDPRFFI